MTWTAHEVRDFSVYESTSWIGDYTPDVGAGAVEYRLSLTNVTSSYFVVQATVEDSIDDSNYTYVCWTDGAGQEGLRADGLAFGLTSNMAHWFKNYTFVDKRSISTPWGRLVCDYYIYSSPAGWFQWHNEIWVYNGVVIRFDGSYEGHWQTMVLKETNLEAVISG